MLASKYFVELRLALLAAQRRATAALTDNMPAAPALPAPAPTEPAPPMPASEPAGDDEPQDLAAALPEFHI